jgi:hypothetical protein
MTVRNTYVFLTGVLCLLLLHGGCKKDQPTTPQPNPCATAKEVSAAFTMGELTDNTASPWYTETDTIYGNKIVRFRAIEENAEYKWYIGSEVITTREVERYFSDAFLNQTLPITLVVKKTPNKSCFPNDDGYDSVTRYVTIVRYDVFMDSIKSRFEGIYKVKSPLLPDSTLIEVRKFFQDVLHEYLQIYNYDGNGSNCTHTMTLSDAEYNYRQLFATSSSGINQCDNLYGDIYCDDKNHASLNLVTGGYVDGSYVNKLHHWKYKGRKIQ